MAEQNHSQPTQPTQQVAETLITSITNEDATEYLITYPNNQYAVINCNNWEQAIIIGLTHAYNQGWPLKIPEIKSEATGQVINKIKLPTYRIKGK